MSADDPCPQPDSVAPPASASLTDELIAGTDVAAALGPWVTRLHEPSHVLLSAFIGLRLEDNGFHLIIPWYDGGMGDRLLLSLVQNGREAGCGCLEGVRIGGCMITKPRSVCITEHGMDPLHDIDVIIDGNVAGTYRGAHKIVLNEAMSRTYEFGTAASFVAVSSHDSVWVRGDSGADVLRRLPGTTVFALDNGSVSDIKHFDLSRRWPRRVQRRPGEVSLLPEPKEWIWRWRIGLREQDPSGRSAISRKIAFRRSLPESCIRSHTPRFGFVNGGASVSLSSEGPILYIPGLEYISGNEPVVSIAYKGDTIELPKAGSIECGGYRVRLMQTVPMTAIGIDPLSEYEISSGDVLLFKHYRQQTMAFDREGRRISTPAGECFIASEASSGWRAPGALYMETADLWGMVVSRAYLPVEASKESIRRALPTFIEIEQGDGMDDTPVMPTIEPEKETAEAARPGPLPRPRRLKEGQVLEDGAVVRSPEAPKDLRKMNLDDLKGEPEEIIRRRILKQVLEHSGVWASDPHPPARRFIGPVPRMTMNGLRFFIRTSCYEGGEQDRLLMEVSQGDARYVLSPSPASIDAGGCRITDVYTVSIEHLGLDPFAEIVLWIDGSEVLRIPASDILMFDAGGNRIGSSDGECTICYRDGRILMIDGVPVETGVVRDGIAFTSVQGRFRDAELIVPRPPEEEPVPAEASEEGPLPTEDSEEAPDEPDEPPSEEPEPAPDAVPGDDGDDGPIIAEDTPEDAPVPLEGDASEGLLEAASELFERRYTPSRGIDGLSLEDVFGGGLSAAGYGDGRGFTDSAPSLFLSGTSVYLFLPAYAGRPGDGLELSLVPADGEPVDLGPMRTGPDGSTRKMLVDLSRHGINPLDAYQAMIDGTVVHRNRRLDFLLFDREGRRVRSIGECSTAVIRSDNMIEGEGFSFEDAYLPDGTAFVTVEPSSDDFWFHIRRPGRIEGLDPRVKVLPERGFLGRSPRLEVRDGSVRLSIPPYRCRIGDPCELVIESQGVAKATVSLGARPDRRALATYPASFRLEDYGIGILDGISASIDGREILSSEPCDSMVFDSSGPVARDPAGDVWFVYRSGLTPCGTSCRVVADIRTGPSPMLRAVVGPGGTLYASGDPWSTERLVEPEMPQDNVLPYIPEAAEEDADPPTASDAAPGQASGPVPARMTDRIRGICEQYPLEEPEPRAEPDYRSGYGFFDAPPRVLLVDGRPVLALPPYSGMPDDPMECEISWNGGGTSLGPLPRDSQYNSGPVCIDLVEEGIDLPSGFDLFIDGRNAYSYPPSVCSIFSASGVRTDLLHGEVSVVLGPRAVLRGAGFLVEEVSGIPGGTVVRASMGDLSYAEIHMAAEPPPVADGHVAVWTDRTFVDEGPGIRISEGRVVLRVPRYRCVPGDPCELSVRTPRGAVHLGGLEIRPGLGAAVTAETTFDLVSRGVDVLDGLSAVIDGTEYPVSGRMDSMAFDASGSPAEPSSAWAFMLCHPGLIPEGGFTVRDLDGCALVSAEGSAVMPSASDETGSEGPGFVDSEPFIQYRDGAVSLRVPPYRGRPWADIICRLVQSGASSAPFELRTRRDGDWKASLPATIPVPASFDPLSGFDLLIDGDTVHTEPERSIMFFPARGGRVRRGGTGAMVAVHHTDEGVLNRHADILWREDTGGVSVVGLDIPPGAYYGLPRSGSADTEKEPAAAAEPAIPSPGIAETVPGPQPDMQDEGPEAPVPEPDDETAVLYMPVPDPDMVERIGSVYRSHPPEDFEPSPEPDHERGYGFFDWPPRLLVMDGRLVLALPPYSGDPGGPLDAAIACTSGTVDLGRMPRESAYSSAPAFVDIAKAGIDVPGGITLTIDGREAYALPASDAVPFGEDGARTESPEDASYMLLGPRTVLHGASFDVLDARPVPGGALVHVSMGDDAVIRLGKAPGPVPDADGHVSLWAERSFVDRLPSIRNSDDGVIIRIPPYRCVPGDPCEVVAESSGTSIPLGRLTARPGLGAAVTEQADLPLKGLGPGLLDGFAVLIDGAEAFRSERTDRLLFTYSGMLSDRPRGETTMLFRMGQVPAGKDFEVLEERELDGVMEIVARIGTRGNLTSTDREAITEPDTDVSDDDAAEDAIEDESEEGLPAEPPDQIVPAEVQAGFTRGAPCMMYTEDGIALRIPPYRCSASMPMDCWIEQSGTRTEPVRLVSGVRYGCRTSSPATMLLPPGIDPLSGFVLFIDGAAVHSEPDREILFFPAGGGKLRRGGRGRSVAVHRTDADIVSSGVEPEWTRDEGGIRFACVDVGFGDYYGPNRRADPEHRADQISAEDILDRDLMRSDGMLESEHRSAMAEKARADAERKRPLPRVELEKDVFRDGGPTIVYDGRGFSLIVPPYVAAIDRGLGLVVFVDGAPVVTSRLNGPVYNGVRITEQMSFPLDGLGASPFDRIEALLDGREVFSKDASDMLVMDRRYRYTGNLEGTAIVALRSGVRFIRHRVTEKSRRYENGMIIVTFECAEGASLEAVRHDRIEPRRLGFRDGRFPSVALRNGRFVLHVPSYVGLGGDRYETDLVLGSRVLPAAPLARSRSSDATVPAEIDLTAMGVSPLEEFVLRIDGEPVFVNRATDRMVFDPEGEQVPAVVGSGYVAIPDGSRATAMGVGIVSARSVGDVSVLEVDSSEGGVVEPGRICERDYANAIREETGSPSPGTDGASATVSFAGHPLDLDVRPLGPSKDEMPEIPFYNTVPSVEVRVSGCRLEDCTIRAETSDGLTAFGPVQATSGKILLDTGSYRGFARAVVSLRGVALASSEYIVDKRYRYSLQGEGPLHAGNLEAVISFGDKEIRVPVNEKNILRYGDRAAAVRFNIALYKISLKLGETHYYDRIRHFDAVPSDLGRMISVHVKLSGSRTPRIRKRVLVSDGGRVTPVTTAWIEGGKKVHITGLLADMAADHRDRHMYIEEEGRGAYEFLTIRYVPPETEGGGETDGDGPEASTGPEGTGSEGRQPESPDPDATDHGIPDSERRSPRADRSCQVFYVAPSSPPP